MGTQIVDENRNTQIISCPERVNVVEFCPYEESGASLLASAGENFVHINLLHFPQFEPDLEEFYSEELVNVRHPSSVTSLSWSPTTTINNHPMNVTFCTGGGDKILRLISVNYKKEASLEILGHHQSFVNDVAIDVFGGTQVASVGDDKKLKIWDIETCKEQVCFGLQSAGSSVKWNPAERGKLMVAEQTGRIRFYDSISNKPIMSFEVGSKPLLSADWSIRDSFKIGANAGGSWYVWDISKSSLPQVTDRAFSSVGHIFRWSHFESNVFAVRGENEVKVYKLNQSTGPMVHRIKNGGGFSWHKCLPVCATGGDRFTELWSLETL